MYVVDDPGTYFWAPFARICAVPEFCSSVLLREALGVAKANDMLLAGQRLAPGEAHACGLVSAVFPRAAFEAELAKRLHAMFSAPLASESLHLFKRMTRHSPVELEKV